MEALTLLSTYLPSEGTVSPGYQDGGGLYALGTLALHHVHIREHESVAALDDLRSDRKLHNLSQGKDLGFRLK